VALSLRKLRSGYSGACVRVRRSSDDAETNVGFSGDTIDEQELLDFANGEDVYVVKWFDQSGNGRDADQGTLADQPQIVQAGSVRTLNGKPAIYNDGSSNKALHTSSATTNKVSAYSVFESVNDNAPQFRGVTSYGFSGKTDTDFGSKAALVISGDQDRGKLWMTGAAQSEDGNKNTPVVEGQGQTIGEGYIDTTQPESQVVVDGTAETASSNAPTTFSDTRLRVFRGRKTGEILLGRLQEVIWYFDDKRTIRKEIYNNINDFYK